MIGKRLFDRNAAPLTIKVNSSADYSVAGVRFPRFRYVSPYLFPKQIDRNERCAAIYKRYLERRRGRDPSTGMAV